MAQDIVIGGRLHSAATGNTVAGANEILDDAKGKKQNVINQEVDNEIGSDSAAGTIKGRIKNLETAVGSGGSVDERIAETKAEIIGDAAADYNTLGKVEDKIQAEVSRSEGAEEALDAAKANKATTLEGYGITDAYTKSETYNKTEVNGLVDTPHQNYVTVLTYAALIAIDPGSTDTIYRVSNYDGSVPQVDVTKYSEYAWDGTQYVFLCVKSQIDEVFDISVYNNNATYADLAAALGTDGANVPQTLRRGGMSVKFVHSVDNKYVQYFLTKDEWSIDPNDWQKMNLEEEVSQLGQKVGEKVNILLGKNLISSNAENWEDGRYLSDGTENANSAYERYKPFVKVEEETDYTFSNGDIGMLTAYAPVVFYDENKAVLGSSTPTTTVNEYTITTPPNCAYLRFSVLDSAFVGTMMLEKGDTKTDYEEFSPIGGYPNKAYVDKYAPLPFTTEVNLYISASNGNTTVLAGYGYSSRKYDVTGVKKIRITCASSVNTQTYQYGFYSSDTTFNSSTALAVGEKVNNQSSGIITLNVPEGAKTLLLPQVLPSLVIQVAESIGTEDVSTAISAVDAKIEKSRIRYYLNGDSVKFAFGYGAVDFLVTMQKKGGNNIFDFANLSTIPVGAKITLAAPTTVLGIGTDWHSPFTVAAVNDIDGDDIANHYYTGGNHQYNNTGSGSTATGRTTSIKLFADGRSVADGTEGVADVLKICWTNLVQGYNTRKADGSGREILQENHTIVVAGGVLKEFVELIALEDITMETWYAFQYSGRETVYPKTLFVGAVNKQETTANAGSGQKQTTDLISYGTSHKIHVTVDITRDLGNRYALDHDRGAFTSGTKAYFDIVYGSVSMAGGNHYYLSGAWEFMPVNP